MNLLREIKVKLFSILLVGILFVPTVLAGRSNDNKSIRLNPEFKINRSSNGSVTVTSRNPDEAAIKHEFSDFYADLLMAAYRKQSMDLITDSLRKKYYMTEDECRREIKHAVNILTEWKIVLRDDELALEQ